MKLGELKGERAIEVIADLIAPITNIASDQKCLNFFKNVQMKKGETARDMAIRNFSERVPELLKVHKKEVLEILCVVNGKNPEEYSLLDIIKGITELANDQDFLSLFLSAVDTEDKTQHTESSVIAELSEPES